MSKRGEFVASISKFRAISKRISEEQRLGILKQGVQKYGLTTDESEGILESFGFVIGEWIDYFKELKLPITDIENQTETTIEQRIDAKHDELYRKSLQAGSRLRTDGRTQDQWRKILNEAKEILKDPQKRQEHIDMVRNGGGLDNFPHDMAPIPAGEFLMGGNDNDALDNEKPQHTVYIDAFYMDMYEVTNVKYKKFIDENPDWGKNSILSEYHDGDYLRLWNGNDYPKDKDYHPVVYVSWYAAMAYARWVGKRLPTEAEWEKASRGGLNNKKYPWGNFRNPSKANYGNYVRGTTPVGSYSPNDYGLYDVSGNVWEWCLDAYNQNFYDASPRDNPISGESLTGITNNFMHIKTRRVLRGGSRSSKHDYIRVAYRGSGDPTGTSDNVGFRCVKEQIP